MYIFKSKMFNIMKYKEITLGDQPVKELTILEYKKWFSLKLFYFCKSNGSQERFHTHSFSSYSFRIFGNYIEEILTGMSAASPHVRKVPRSFKRLIFIPKEQFHQITKSTGCLTIMCTGPWSEVFQEYRDGTVTTLTHGRRVI